VKPTRPTWRHANIGPLRVRCTELLRLREYVQHLEDLRSGMQEHLEDLRSGMQEGGAVFGGISLTLDRRRHQPLHVGPLLPNGNSAAHQRPAGRKPGR